MTFVSWLGFFLLAAAAALATLWLYHRREAPGRGRGLLAGLRIVALALLLLLLFDPELPAGARTGSSNRAVLVDASLSMGLPGEGGATRWASALEALARGPGGVVLTFGDAARAVSPDSLRALGPSASRSALLPALQAAAETGVTRATVLTDAGIDDLEETLRWLPRLGLAVSVQRVGTAAVNRGVAEIRAPRWVESGSPIEIHAGVAAVGVAGDSVEILVSHDGRTVAQSRVAVPTEGRIAPSVLRFDAVTPPEETIARYDIRLAGGDDVPDDDVRTIYVDVTGEPAGLTLVSFQPDWEPRFLVPVLERALGLPVQAFLRAGPASWVRIGSGLRSGTRVSEADVRRALEEAGLVVLHAYGEDTPAWGREAATTARRVLLFPAADPGGAPLPVRVGPAAAADWYLSDVIPPSPVAQHLAGLSPREIPPLPALHLVDAPAGSWAPAHLSRGRRGVAYPLALAGTTGGRRWSVALAQGYWRWAFRDPTSRDVYERLWSALGGWLVEDQIVSRDAVMPLTRTVGRGQPARFVAPGVNADSFRLAIHTLDGVVVMDSVLEAAGTDTLVAPVLPPAHYRYTVRAFAGDAELSGRGPMTVESYSDEFTRPAVDVSGLESVPASATTTMRRAGSPLRLSPFPWLIIILLLCAEWILRRRWGLR